MKCMICDGDMRFLGDKAGFALMQCTCCNYVRVYPIPAQEVLNLYYDEKFFDANYNPSVDSEIYNLRKNQYALDRKLIGMFAEDGMVFDYGCGNGEFLADTQYRVYGYEPNPVARAFAEQKIRMIDSGWFQGDFFDVIVMRGVIEHLIDPIKTIMGLVSQLKQNGHFIIISTPNSDSPAMFSMGTGWKLVTPPYHLHYFNPRNLDLVFKRVGCELLHMEFPYFGTPYFGDKGAYPGSMMTLVFKKL